MSKISEAAKKYEEHVISMRHDLHRHPELGGHEEWTSQYICDELDSIGLPYERVNNYNVIALLDTGRDGKRVALRADIDGLPVQEEAEVDFKSEVDGMMHACGHDSHAAMLLGAARVLKEMEADLNGKIYFCFQIGEEIGIGAEDCVEYLKAHGGVDRVAGLHIGAIAPTGTIGLLEGPMMAGAASWKLTVHGKGGHGSMPARSIDPIKPAADILTRLSALLVNRLDPLDPVVVSPCMFHSGTAMNIIPEKAVVEGNLRYFSDEAYANVTKLMHDIAETVAASYGARAELVIDNSMAKPVHNDPESIRMAREVVADIDGLTAFVSPKMMGSDNFADFVRAFPGFYCFMGAGIPGDPNGMMPNHHPKFTLDEKSFRLGVEFLAKVAVKFLGA